MGVACSCCGLERDPETVGALQSHDEIKVCRDCIGWLARRSGMLDVTPILPARSTPEAIAFYEAAGFQPRSYDNGYAFVQYADASVFDLVLNASVDPANNGAGCFIVTYEADGWHARLSGAGLPVTAIGDLPWGMREFTLTDPSGNHVRIGRSI